MFIGPKVECVDIAGGERLASVALVGADLSRSSGSLPHAPAARQKRLTNHKRILICARIIVALSPNTAELRNNESLALFASMDNDKDMLEAIAKRLKEELDVEDQRLPADIVVKLFAVDAAEKLKPKT